MSGANPDQPDQIVIVVHGIGDPQQGESLNLLGRSMADAEQPFVETPETLWLREKSAASDHVQTFPVQRTRVSYEHKNIELCEAFWGDLSRVGLGWTGVLRGIFQIVFGLRYVAYVAADQSGSAAYWLKKLGLISARILQGPVLAVTVFLGLLIVAVCGSHLLWKESYLYTQWPQVTILACCMFALVVSLAGAKITGSRVVERFWFWLSATSAFVLAVMLVRMFWLDASYPQLTHACEAYPGEMWYCRVLVILLGFLWFAEIQVLTAMAICCAVAIGNPKNHQLGLLTGFLLPALAVGVWAQAIPMSWLAIKESVGTLGSLTHVAQVFDDAIPFLGVQMIMLLILMLTQVIVLVRYASWRSNSPEESFRQGNRAPRLIIHPAMKIVLALSTGVGIVVVSVLWCLNTFGDGHAYADSKLAQSLASANGYTISLVVPLGSLFVFFLPHLRAGFDMVLDVANHFYFRPTSLADVLDDDDEFNIAETTFQNGQLFFSRREANHDRLRRILAYYRDQYSHHPQLVIVSHSQGTMVAIETLNDKDLDWLNNVFSTVTLVTMGSPFSHLYQHYFGHLYPDLAQPFWASLRRRLDRWVNIFRVDDYVGNEIDFPNENYSEPSSAISTDQNLSTNLKSTVASQMQCTNISVGARGHVGYWSDREVLENLRRELYWANYESASEA